MLARGGEEEVGLLFQLLLGGHSARIKATSSSEQCAVLGLPPTLGAALGQHCCPAAAGFWHSTEIKCTVPANTQICKRK